MFAETLLLHAMAMLFSREVAADTFLGIWHITEETGWFQSRLMLSENEIALIDSIRHPQRKLHWLSSRVLVRTLLQTDHFIQLESDMNGKPVIRNFPVELSLSHSAEYSALLISKKYKVGIDIEKMNPKVLRIRHKFMSEGELQWIEPGNQIAQLYTCWCAKEAMYKLYGEKKLDFRRHLTVYPFTYQGSGSLKGKINKGNYRAEPEVRYECFGDYMMAYVLG